MSFGSPRFPRPRPHRPRRRRAASARGVNVAPKTGVGSSAQSVLLVDDVVEIRYLLRMLLANVRLCHVVGEAEDGRQAIAQAEELKPDIVILDVEMPILTGIEALPRILEADPGAAVIIYSSGDPRVEQKALALGAFRYVPKGKDPTAVVDAVREAVASRLEPTPSS